MAGGGKSPELPHNTTFVGRRDCRTIAIYLLGGTHKSAFCKRGSVNVRFAPKATEVLHCRESTRCAKRRPEQVQQMTWRRPLLLRQFARCRGGEAELFGRH